MTPISTIKSNWSNCCYGVSNCRNSSDHNENAWFWMNFLCYYYFMLFLCTFVWVLFVYYSTKGKKAYVFFCFLFFLSWKVSLFLFKFITQRTYITFILCFLFFWSLRIYSRGFSDLLHFQEHIHKFQSSTKCSVNFCAFNMSNKDPSILDRFP